MQHAESLDVNTSANGSFWSDQIVQQGADCHCYDDLDEDRFCFDENFNSLSLADPQLSANDRKQSSIFTHSGNNFVFGNIMAPPEAEAKNNAVDPIPEAIASAPMPVSTAYRVHEVAAETGVAATPANDTNAPALTGLATEFINTFRREGRPLPSSIVSLTNMLMHFPELVYVVRNAANNEFEVHFLRDRLIKTLRLHENRFPNLVFTSFERGLKHAGMEVIQSTHGQIQVRKWGMKKGFVPKAAGGAGKARKRKESSDDDFFEEAKKQRPDRTFF